MNHLQVRDLFPAPFSKIIFTPIDLRALGKAYGKDKTAEEIWELKQGRAALRETKSMIKAALHLIFFGVGWSIVRSLKWDHITVCFLGSILSMPSMFMAGSFYALSFGARSLFCALETGSFWQFAVGMLSIGGSYAVLDQIEMINLGFLEKGVNVLGEKGSYTVAAYFYTDCDWKINLTKENALDLCSSKQPLFMDRGDAEES